MSAIEFKNVSKDFKDANQTVHALKNTNIRVEKGEFVAIIGPSGSGKSTFLTLAGGLQKPSEGQIIIGDKDISKLKEKEMGRLRLKEIGFILQASNLVPFLKIKDQFKLFDKVNKTNRSEYMNNLLGQLGIDDLLEKYPEDISGGQRQRVAIVKALYNDPSIILADEPTASLDTDKAFEVVKILAEESKKQNKAIIMVTHDIRLVQYCDRVFKITDGVLTEEIKNGKAEI